METEKKSNGALLGSIVIIVILIIGGIYIWQAALEQKNAQLKNSAALELEANSGELDILEQDLNAADIETGVDVNGTE